MENKTKIWKTVGTFNTFELADRFRNSLKEKYELVKVRRGKSEYRVKAWNPPAEKEESQLKKKTVLKKGQHAQRGKKNVNKKVRTRQER